MEPPEPDTIIRQQHRQDQGQVYVQNVQEEEEHLSPSPQSQSQQFLDTTTTLQTNSHKRCMVIPPDIDSDRESISSTPTLQSYQKNEKRKKRRKYIYVDVDDDKGNNKKHRFMNELIQGVFIYAICIVTPVLFGILVKWYEHYFQSATAAGNGNEQINDDYYNGREEAENLEYNGKDNSNNNNNNVYSFFISLFSMEQIYNTITKILFNIHSHSNIVTRFTARLSSYSWDVQFIIMATILQSLLRVILVHLLVPRYLVPRRLVALVRNKSTHLLSASAYQWQGHKQKQKQQQNTFFRREEFVKSLSDTLAHTGHSLRRSLGHETSPSPSRKNVYDNTPIGGAGSTFSMQQKLSLPPLSTTITTSSNYEFDYLDATQALRLFSAPRYATAMFRLLCCTISCLWALTHFRKASYWPIWVGGSIGGNTKYCWDLSGNVDPSFVLKRDQNNEQEDMYSKHQLNQSAGGDVDHHNRGLGSLDSDFDNQNSALRYFFLGQASYQLQSLCFHFLSMALLLIYSSMKGNNNSRGGNENRGEEEGDIISARSSFKSYLRPVVEHSIYFVLTLTTFFFSALRRLGSITIFALELSSLVLQLLQICINAPESSRLRSPRVIKFVHHYLAIPVFVYCRLFILPFVVQYSAAFESSVWLRQIDHAFLPGCGKMLIFIFNGMLAFTLVLNFVYLRRLIFHPHVQFISGTR